MTFQGKEFTQGMKQLVVNLKQCYDIERRQKNFKAAWAIEQTAKGLDIGEATVRRIMADYNKNKQFIPEDRPKARGRPEHMVSKDLHAIARRYIRSQNLMGQHVSVELVREHLYLWHRKASVCIKGTRLCNPGKEAISQAKTLEPKTGWNIYKTGSIS